MEKKTALINALFFIIVINVIISASAITSYQNISQSTYQNQQYAGEKVQLKFKEKTILNLYGNVTINMSIECDVDNVGDQTFNFSYYGKNNVAINMSINASNNFLQNGDIIKTRNQSMYQFKNRFILNISRNTTDTMQTELRIKVKDENCTWAYYNKSNSIWEIVPSEYTNEFLSTNISHYSLYTVLSGIIIDETYESESSNINVVGISIAILGSIFTIIIFIKIYKSKSPEICPNGMPKINGKCD